MVLLLWAKEEIEGARGHGYLRHQEDAVLHGPATNESICEAIRGLIVLSTSRSRGFSCTCSETVTSDSRKLLVATSDTPA